MSKADSQSSDISSNRYERKYLTQDYGPHQLEQQLLLHPAFFRQIYHQRKVWSIYFDTPELDYYHTNIHGAFKRKKIRVRWYEDQQQLSNLQIEVKIKTGELIKKINIPIEKKIIEISLEKITRIVQNQLEAYIPEAVNINPVMVNSYQRKYFLSRSTGMRITIDSDLRFQQAGSWQNEKTEQRLDATILECKYSVQDDPNLANIAQGLPLSITRSSKYILGIQICLPH
jgi:SPX domain protein involved in polyphosphate accumulation